MAQYIKYQLPPGADKKVILENLADLNAWQAKILSEEKTVTKPDEASAQAFHATAHKVIDIRQQEDGSYKITYQDLIKNVTKLQMGLNIWKSMCDNLVRQATEKDIAPLVKEYTKAEQKKVRDVIKIDDASIE